MYRRYPVAILLFAIFYGTALVSQTGATLDLTWQVVQKVSEFTGTVVSELASASSGEGAG